MYLAGNVSNGDFHVSEGDILVLEDISDRFRRLLFEDILPIWSTTGMDRVAGGFCESITADGRVPAVPRRIRVSARQIYVFSEASRLGLNPAVATNCIRHGDEFLRRHGGEYGLISHSIAPDGTCLDAGYDLYDQAFLLLAWASAYRHLGERTIQQRGRALSTSIRRYFGHGAGGFVDRTDRPFPLRANPHMHLLEAALAWMAIDDDPAWQQLADEIVTLFQSRFFDPVSGVVREIFTPDWMAIEEEGRCRVEPGHHYEWAWLLLRWQMATGGDAGDCPQRMIAFAETYGYDPVRQVAINECWNDGLPSDKSARLWPQTERLKAWLAVAEVSSGAAKRSAETKALDAARGLLPYLDGEARGLWQDLMREDGSFKAGAAPASSLYHIICALGELSRYLQPPVPVIPAMDGSVASSAGAMMEFSAR